MIRASWLGLVLALAVPAAAAESNAPAAEPESGPLLSRKFGEFSLQVPVSLSGFVEGIGGYPLDRYGTTQPGGVALAPRARVGLIFDSGRRWNSLQLHGEYEQDLINGYKDFREGVPAGIGMPYSGGLSPNLRKAYLRAVVSRSFVVAAGVMTSHWGLGLLANDGAHGWTPGSARFSEPRGGDRVARVAIGTVPLTSAGLMFTAGFDRAWADGTLLADKDVPEGSGLGGDYAYQGFIAATFGYQRPTSGGIYGVQRWQKTGDGRTLNATVVDATASTSVKVGESSTLSLGAEGVFIAGSTNFAATPEFPTQKVRQLGVAARAGLDMGRYGTVLDVLFASGDQNSDDETQNGFKANVNYHMGMFLFRELMAAQSGRAARNAGDPELVGLPSQGLDRYPTRGSITNTISVFPRLWWRPVKNLEVYGGALFAISAVPVADPLNSRLSGGAVRNYQNGSPGQYLGTEGDLGVRYQVAIQKTTLGIGVEGGMLFPGSAFTNASGAAMGNIAGGRLILDYRL